MLSIKLIWRDEADALDDWHRELAKLEESRLQELDENYRIVDGSQGLSGIETESQLIERFIPADEISMNTDSADLEKFSRRSSYRFSWHAFNNFII